MTNKGKKITTKLSSNLRLATWYTSIVYDSRNDLGCLFPAQGHKRCLTMHAYFCRIGAGVHKIPSWFYWLCIALADYFNKYNYTYTLIYIMQLGIRYHSVVFRPPPTHHSNLTSHTNQFDVIPINLTSYHSIWRHTIQFDVIPFNLTSHQSIWCHTSQFDVIPFNLTS